LAVGPGLGDGVEPDVAGEPLGRVLRRGWTGVDLHVSSSSGFWDLAAERLKGLEGGPDGGRSSRRAGLEDAEADGWQRDAVVESKGRDVAVVVVHGLSCRIRG